MPRENLYILIMIFSIFSDYMHAMIIDKNRGNIKSKMTLISSIIVNLSLITFFKYSDFLISIYNNIYYLLKTFKH